MTGRWDAVVVGSGPNGLAAAIELARAGHGVLLIEAGDTLGGGLRTSERTLSGFLHDECSAIHPLGILSPFFRSLPLAEHGLEWLRFPRSVAHPLDAGPTPWLERSLEASVARLGADADAWRALIAPFLPRGHELVADALGPLRLASASGLARVRFGLAGLRSASGLARRFATDGARALFAGLAAHSVLPLERAPSAAVGLLFAISAHLEDWPCVRGGSGALARALASVLVAHGGRIELGRRVARLADLPPSRVVLFDLTPEPFVALAGEALPARYVARLRRFRYGPGVFKLDWALDGPIPWRDPEVARASTVHVGGTLEEIADSERAAWEGRLCERPFLIVCQQSQVDASRAPSGKHTGYAYAHVPSGCASDRTEVIEAQIERFAPGFRDRILARRATAPADLQAKNPNFAGGAITGGASDLAQLFRRPTSLFAPYGTPDPRLFLCSASTPPGGGVHGMCGSFAARAALRRLGR